MTKVFVEPHELVQQFQRLIATLARHREEATRQNDLMELNHKIQAVQKSVGFIEEALAKHGDDHQASYREVLGRISTLSSIFNYSVAEAHALMGWREGIDIVSARVRDAQGYGFGFHACNA